MAKVPNGVETLRKISIAWVGCTNVTDDRRQTDLRRHEFTFAKNCTIEQTVSSNTVCNCPQLLGKNNSSTLYDCTWTTLQHNSNVQFVTVTNTHLRISKGGGQVSPLAHAWRRPWHYSDDIVLYKSDETVNFCGFRCATTSPITVL